jgi:hypothetical protein
MQLPPTQRLPAPHAGASPHWQTPLVEQPSAARGSQATHVPPPVPQVASELALQAPLAQQPFGQVVSSQTQLPLMHLVPGPQGASLPHRQAPDWASQVSAAEVSHAAHAAPPLPHA